VLVDTAGRMQDNEPLMRSLSKLVNLNNPDLVLFVGEALVGNDSIDQVRLCVRGSVCGRVWYVRGGSGGKQVCVCVCVCLCLGVCVYVCSDTLYCVLTLSNAQVRLSDTTTRCRWERPCPWSTSRASRWCLWVWGRPPSTRFACLRWPCAAPNGSSAVGSPRR
jgi:hypothetical protein